MLSLQKKGAYSMQIAFFSNFLNHHQLPFCLAMDRLTGGQFTFVATTPVPQARLRMGYHDMNKGYPFALMNYDGFISVLR